MASPFYFGWLFRFGHLFLCGERLWCGPRTAPDWRYSDHFRRASHVRYADEDDSRRQIAVKFCRWEMINEKWYEIWVFTGDIFYFFIKKNVARGYISTLSQLSRLERNQPKLWRRMLLYVYPFTPFRFNIRTDSKGDPSSHTQLRRRAVCHLKGKSFAFWNFLFSFSTILFFILCELL